MIRQFVAGIEAGSKTKRRLEASGTKGNGDGESQNQPAALLRRGYRLRRAYGGQDGGLALKGEIQNQPAGRQRYMRR
jgi:hypothetical protein